MSAGFATERRSGVLRCTCLGCGDLLTMPDKGIGRANIAAWKSRHQHPTTTDTSPGDGAREDGTE